MDHLKAKAGAASILHNLLKIPETSYVSVEHVTIDTDAETVSFTYKLVPRIEHPSLYLSNIRGLMETGKSRPASNERPMWTDMPLFSTKEAP